MSTPEPPPSQVIAAATGPRDAQPAVPKADDSSWTETDLKYCKSKAREAAEAADKRRLFAVSTDRVGLGGPSTSMIERSAHLLCTATRKPQHLCKSYWRKKFVKAIQEYAADFRKVSAQVYWTNYNVAERARRTSSIDKADWQAVTDDLRQTTREMARMHEDIVAAFRRLIADGIIDPDAFGVFFGLGIPPDIAKLIGEARPIRDLCG